MVCIMAFTVLYVTILMFDTLLVKNNHSNY